MVVTSSITKRKQLFDLPIRNEELEYWGPVDTQFSNSFLTMGNEFIERYVSYKSKVSKKAFICLVELVQNIAEYNAIAFKDNTPDAYLDLQVKKGFIQIRTGNILKATDVELLSQKFKAIFEMNQSALEAANKEAILNGKSLGLIMIRRMEGAAIDWEIQAKDNTHWLVFELRFEL
ncbi:MAG: DUF6272 family protein [Vicingaceae bacterium]